MTSPRLAFARAAYDAVPLYDPKRAPVALDLTDNTNLWGVPPTAERTLRTLPVAAITRYPSLYAADLKAALADADGPLRVRRQIDRQDPSHRLGDGIDLRQRVVFHVRHPDGTKAHAEAEFRLRAHADSRHHPLRLPDRPVGARLSSAGAVSGPGSDASIPTGILGHRQIGRAHV